MRCDHRFFLEAVSGQTRSADCQIASQAAQFQEFARRHQSHPFLPPNHLTCSVCVCVNLHWNIHLFKICNALYWNILKLVYIQVGVALLGAEPMHKEPRWRCWSARRAPSQVPVMSWNSRFHQDTKLKNTQRRIQHAFIRRIWWIALNSKLDKAPNLLSKNCQCVCRKNTMDRL